MGIKIECILCNDLLYKNFIYNKYLCKCLKTAVFTLSNKEINISINLKIKNYISNIDFNLVTNVNIILNTIDGSGYIDIFNKSDYNKPNYNSVCLYSNKPFDIKNYNKKYVLSLIKNGLILA